MEHLPVYMVLIKSIGCIGFGVMFIALGLELIKFTAGPVKYTKQLFCSHDYVSLSTPTHFTHEGLIDFKFKCAKCSKVKYTKIGDAPVKSREYKYTDANNWNDFD